MITEKDLELISHLRKNARKKVTNISKEMNMPVTTIYDKIRAHERKGIIKKHVSIIDFRKLGYNVNVMMAFRVNRDKRAALQEYLTQHKNINSLFRVDYGHDFMVEMMFEDIGKMHEFIDNAQKNFGIEEPKIFNVIDEIKREEFMV
jgi:Lrp/AsnC family transcriptional regulator, regulator for asnA, asnC and gidA